LLFEISGLDCNLTGVHVFVRHVALWLIHLGAFGPLVLGIFDSSFLVFPFGNDLLVVILTARNHDHLPLYVVTAALGSTAGVLLLDLVSRKGGEEGLKRMLSLPRLEYFKKKIGQHAALSLALASVAPPPFPFTLVVAATSAFQYPRARLLPVVFGARTIRFTLVSLLALRFGRGILRIIRSVGFEYFMLTLIAFCIVASLLQILRWRHRAPA